MLIEAFILGLLTPTTAVCVLPLFPGFLSFLAQQTAIKSRYAMAIFGLLVSLGVIIFMLLFGLLFSSILQQSLTNYITLFTPIAMLVLLAISILLIIDFDFSRIFPHFNAPNTKNPYFSAFLFGFFFAAIVIPCQPSFLAVFFARQFIEIFGFFTSMMNFLAFGIGMAAPLLLFSLISLRWSRQILGFITRHKTIINRVTGSIMLAITVYYLFFVFRIQELL